MILNPNKTQKRICGGLYELALCKVGRGPPISDGVISRFTCDFQLLMRAALNEEVRGPASTNVPCPPQTDPWGGPLASEWELNCAGFDFLPVSAYHDLSFCCIDLPQFDNVGQNRMHTFAGDVDGMRAVGTGAQ